jgi:GntR family transcriptional regulator, transcriptional repressor for pyruvate dehydrogenase complex
VLLERFKKLIADGALRPGSRLPSERELAPELGVNRGTLRQTLKVLETLGVVTQRVGDGTYVNSHVTSVLEQPIELLVLLGDITVDERYMARRAVEPQLASQAALLATDDDLRRMRAALDEMARSDTLEERREADLAFHEAVMAASGNRLCHLILRALHRSVGVDPMARQMALEDAVEAHRAIYEAIAKRDADAANAAMTSHLDCCARALKDHPR